MIFPLRTTMENVLSISEIYSQFAGEWVLIGDPQTSAAMQVQSGRVLCHSTDRDEVYRYAVANRPSRFAVIYTGTMPPDTAIAV